MSNVWNIFQEQTRNNKTLAHKTQFFFLIPLKHIKISDICLQNLKNLKNIVDFNNNN